MGPLMHNVIFFFSLMPKEVRWNQMFIDNKKLSEESEMVEINESLAGV